MKDRREAALRARLRALEAARECGHEADMRAHLQAIKRLVGWLH